MGRSSRGWRRGRASISGAVKTPRLALGSRVVLGCHFHEVGSARLRRPRIPPLRDGVPAFAAQSGNLFWEMLYTFRGGRAERLVSGRSIISPPLLMDLHARPGGQKGKPGFRNTLRKDGLQRPGIDAQLGRIETSPLLQFAGRDVVGLEVHQPDFRRKKHDQIRDALHHNEIPGCFSDRRFTLPRVAAGRL